MKVGTFAIVADTATDVTDDSVGTAALRIVQEFSELNEARKAVGDQAPGNYHVIKMVEANAVVEEVPATRRVVRGDTVARASKAEAAPTG